MQRGGAAVTQQSAMNMHYDGDLEGLDQHKKQIVAAFYRESTWETIAADVKGLSELYQVVAAEGGWPPAHMT